MSRDTITSSVHPHRLLFTVALTWTPLLVLFNAMWLVIFVSGSDFASLGQNLGYVAIKNH